MGIVARQGAKYSILNFAAAGIGLLSTLFVYPLALKETGFLRYFISTAALLMPFVLLGIGSVSIRFFPRFKNASNANEGFLGLISLIAAIGSALFLLLCAIFWDRINGFFENKGGYYEMFGIYIIPLTILVSYSYLFSQYSSNFRRIVIPSLFHEVLVKFTLPILLLAYIFLNLPAIWLIYGVILNYVIALSGISIYLRKLGQFSLVPRLKTLDKALKKEMAVFAGYGILGTLGMVLALQIDIFMVGSLLDELKTGVFVIAVNLAALLEIPVRSINRIASPIVAENWEKENLIQIDDLYKKSSDSLLSFGIGFFLCIVILLDPLFDLMPNSSEIALGKPVVIFYCLAKIINMATSINGAIIGFSKYFRFNLYFILILGALNISMNLWLIPKYGLNGAAIATLISLGSYNILRSGFLWWKLKMHPFSSNTMKLLIIAFIVYLIGYFLPDFESAISNILYQGFIIAAIYTFVVLRLNISPDFNALVNRYLNLNI